MENSIDFDRQRFGLKEETLKRKHEIRLALRFGWFIKRCGLVLERFIVCGFRRFVSAKGIDWQPSNRNFVAKNPD